MAEKEAAKKLMNELKAIEDQILEHEATLKANNIGMDEPLTDEQDHRAVRHARRNIRCLQNDKKNKMAEIEQILAKIHQSSKGGQEEKAESAEEEEEEEVHRTSNRPFVQVEKVQPNSPAQNAVYKKRRQEILEISKKHEEINNLKKKGATKLLNLNLPNSKKEEIKKNQILLAEKQKEYGFVVATPDKRSQKQKLEAIENSQSVSVQKKEMRKQPSSKKKPPIEEENVEEVQQIQPMFGEIEDVQLMTEGVPKIKDQYVSGRKRTGVVIDGKKPKEIVTSPISNEIANETEDTEMDHSIVEETDDEEMPMPGTFSHISTIDDEIEIVEETEQIKLANKISISKNVLTVRHNKAVYPTGPMQLQGNPAVDRFLEQGPSTSAAAGIPPNPRPTSNGPMQSANSAAPSNTVLQNQSNWPPQPPSVGNSQTKSKFVMPDLNLTRANPSLTERLAMMNDSVQDANAIDTDSPNKFRFTENDVEAYSGPGEAGNGQKNEANASGGNGMNTNHQQPASTKQPKYTKPVDPGDMTDSEVEEDDGDEDDAASVAIAPGGTRPAVRASQESTMPAFNLPPSNGPIQQNGAFGNGQNANANNHGNAFSGIPSTSCHQKAILNHMMEKANKKKAEATSNGIGRSTPAILQRTPTPPPMQRQAPQQQKNVAFNPSDDEEEEGDLLPNKQAARNQPVGNQNNSNSMNAAFSSSAPQFRPNQQQFATIPNASKDDQNAPNLDGTLIAKENSREDPNEEANVDEVQDEEEAIPEDGQNNGNLDDQVQIEEEASTKIQAWWRGILYRQRKMLPEHKEKLRICVQEFRNAPCSEENPKEERNEPLNLRIERYMPCLLSTVLTERKAMALRLNRLADRSHVAIECMLGRNIFKPILDCLSELNRSEAHLYVIRPLCALIVKLLSQKPLVEPFALQHLDGLLSNAINLIHKNYKDAEVVRDQTKALGQLSVYPGFAEKMVALRFDWYMQKLKCLERFNQQRDDPRLLAYKRLCELNELIKAAQTPNDA